MIRTHTGTRQERYLFESVGRILLVPIMYSGTPVSGRTLDWANLVSVKATINAHGEPNNRAGKGKEHYEEMLIRDHVTEKVRVTHFW